jgi:hypothetical protein
MRTAVPTTTLIHKIPLSLALKADGSVAITCEVAGICADPTSKQLLLLHKPGSKSSNHLYCYTIATPPANDKFVYYLSVYSGEHTEALVAWQQPGGLATSPTFDLGDGEAASVISVSVLAEPRLITTDGVNDGSLVLSAPPRTFAGRRHVKSDFQGGEDGV